MENLKKTISIFIRSSLFILMSSLSCQAQNNPWLLFGELMNKNWEGQYVGLEDSTYLHQIKWEFILDSMAVMESKEVGELEFKMKTFYYFDWEKGQLSFNSILNREINSKGKVYLNASKIILEGKNYFRGGSSDFRKIFEVNEKVELIDEFFLRKGDSFVRRHVIKYR